jgi:hypothetical protein
MEPHRNRPDPNSKHIPADDESSLKGTLASVLIIAGVIVVTWLSVFSLFLSRM